MSDCQQLCISRFVWCYWLLKDMLPFVEICCTERLEMIHFKRICDVKT